MIFWGKKVALFVIQSLLDCCEGGTGWVGRCQQVYQQAALLNSNIGEGAEGR